MLRLKPVLYQSIWFNWAHVFIFDISYSLLVSVFKAIAHRSKKQKYEEQHRNNGYGNTWGLCDGVYYRGLHRFLMNLKHNAFWLI